MKAQRVEMLGDPEKCFACGRAKKTAGFPAVTADGQHVEVGDDCYRHIRDRGRLGYQPPSGGPRLWCLSAIGAVQGRKS